MSFDIFVNFHRAGEFEWVPVAVLDRVFGHYAKRNMVGIWDLRYPDGGHGILYFSPDVNDEIRSFSVNRPPGGPLFWEGILKILRETPAVLYWGAEKNPIVVASEAMIDELPKGMINVLGRPQVVTTIKEILEKIRKS